MGRKEREKEAGGKKREKKIRERGRGLPVGRAAKAGGPRRSAAELGGGVFSYHSLLCDWPKLLA